MFTSSSSTLGLAILLLITGISPVAAFWRLLCDNAVTTGRYDPIVSPGQIAGHAHTIVGGSGFGMSTSYDQMRQASCTSCQISQDLSNYWIPSLYYQNANNGSFESVNLIGGMTVYYLQRGNNVTAFPPGFQMLAGNPNLRSAGSSLEQGAINFVCLDYNGGSSSSTGLPTKNCPQGLRAQIVFPSCWNGKDLDSANHKSHMAYPDGISTGNCPAGFPIRLVTIFYEVTFIVNDFASRWYSGRDQPFVFAMGDPTGYGLHGDFVNGWEQKFLQSAVDTCTNASGLQEDCPLFDLKYGQNCHITPQINEVVSGTLKTLPGCNPVQFGPGPATAQTCSDTTTPTVWNSTVQYKGLTAPPDSHFLANEAQTVKNYSSWQYVGCYSDSNTRTFPALVGVTGSLTVESCLDACLANDYAYGGLEAGSQCWCGNTAPSATSASLLTYASCYSTCPGNSLELCGGGWALSVYNNTGVVPPSIPATSTDLSAKYTGCYIDNANRIMPMSMGSTNSTVDGCVSACQSAGYPYSGIEYMGQCYCSTALPASSLKTTDADCNMKCSGDKTKLCGAGYRLQMYSGKAKTYTPPVQALTYAGCYTDSVSARSLSKGVASNKTIEGCIASCTTAGYKIAGLEYGGECWCDNVVTASMAKAPESDCNMRCSGNSAEFCGAGNRLSVYNATALVAPSIQLSAGSMSYIGCFVDDSSRVMKGFTPRNKTVAGCVSTCQSAGYSQAGIEYGGECYCGPLASRSVKAPDSDCSMTCSGDLTRLCGAGWRLQMYNSTLTASSSSIQPSPTPLAIVAGRIGLGATTSTSSSKQTSSSAHSAPGRAGFDGTASTKHASSSTTKASQTSAGRAGFGNAKASSTSAAGRAGFGNGKTISSTSTRSTSSSLSTSTRTATSDTKSTSSTASSSTSPATSSSLSTSSAAHESTSVSKPVTSSVSTTTTLSTLVPTSTTSSATSSSTVTTTTSTAAPSTTTSQSTKSTSSTSSTVTSTTSSEISTTTSSSTTSTTSSTSQFTTSTILLSSSSSSSSSTATETASSA